MRARFWNGRLWETRKPFLPQFTYGAECHSDAGRTDDCPERLTRSPFVTDAQELYGPKANVPDRVLALKPGETADQYATGYP